MQDKSMQMQETASLSALAMLAVLSVIFIIMQMWSLILTRIIYRGLLIVTVIFLLTVGIAWALGALKLYKPDNTMVVALGLILGVIMTLASFIIVRINDDTYDYIND
jgi:hypothetical protein